MSSGNIDIEKIFKGQISVKPEEHPDERSSRVAREDLEIRVEIYKGVAIFIVFLIGLIASSLYCVYEISFAPNALPETKHWAQTILSSLITGAASFVAGRKIGSR